MMKPSFVIVGCGKVGISLGKFLAAAGYRPAGCVSRSLASAQTAAEMIGSDHFGSEPETITPRADIVLITTPDGAIGQACEEIAARGGFRPDAVVLHCSGALPSTVLSAARTSGAHIGSMHPLQSFAAIAVEHNPFQGIIVSIEGDDPAVRAAEQMGEALGATCCQIKTDAKTLYHASAVVASNYLVTLFDLAFRLIAEAGITGPSAFAVLKPLVDGTLKNIETVGIPEALTGPIARGDVQTVEDHCRAIGAAVPELLALYNQLGAHTVGVARAKGTLTEAAAEALARILKSGR